MASQSLGSIRGCGTVTVFAADDRLSCFLSAKMSKEAPKTRMTKMRSKVLIFMYIENNEPYEDSSRKVIIKVDINSVKVAG
jgi:hypothetical protein